MTRILFVTHDGTLVGGPTHSLLQLVKYLRSDYDITVLTPGNGLFVSELREWGIRTEVRPMRLRYMLPLIWFIVRCNPDLVYGNNYCYPAHYAFLAAKLLRRPFIWHIREMMKQPNSRFAYRRLMYQSMTYADAVIANSQATAQSIEEFVGVKDAEVILNGVDPEEFVDAAHQGKPLLNSLVGVQDTDIVITNIGRVFPNKNQLEVVKVAAQITSDYPSVKFCLLGHFQDKEYVDLLRTTIRDLGLDGTVHLLGYRTDVATILSESDILLHTAKSEPQGRVVLEAMASALPVVAYNDGAIGEVLEHGASGFLVPFGDLDTLAASIRQLLEDPDLCRRMGCVGREVVQENYSADNIAKQVKMVIERVVGNS